VKNLARCLGFALLALGSLEVGHACAADLARALPVKAAPPPALVPDWGGWGGSYIGVVGGGSWGTARQTDVLGFDTGNYDISGGLIGLTWGRNYQFGQWVLGLEDDISKTWIKGSIAANGACGAVKCSADMRWLSTTRGRAGIDLGQFMPYVTAGLAWAGVHGHEGNVLVPGRVGGGTQFQFGVAAGAGVEARVAPNLTAKVEYLYIDFGRGRVFDDLIGGALVTQELDLNTHIVRAGLSYQYDPTGSKSSLFAKGPAALWSWKGSYVGAVAAAGFGRSSQTTPALGSGTFDMDGGVYGLTLGFNHQIGPWVWGIESDRNFTNVSGSTTGPSAVGFETWLHGLETVRGRVGYAYGPWLPYVTGGVAFGEVRATVNTPGGSLEGSQTHGGWTAGAGLEYAFLPSWSLKGEYLYTQLNTGAHMAVDDVETKFHMVRAGVNYHYDLGALLGRFGISGFD
jgi:outer membrane immunogenic protein